MRALMGFVGAAVAALLPSVATAQAEKPIQLSIGGYFMGYMAGKSEQDGVGQPGEDIRNYGIFRKSRIEFEGLGRLDNGIKVGFRVQLRGEASQGDQIDRSYIFGDTPIGRFELGKQRGPAFQMHVAAPNPFDVEGRGFGQDYPDFVGLTAPSTNMVKLVGGHLTYIDTFKYEKIAYYTPRLAGLQVGMSYAPQSCSVGAPTGPNVCGIGTAFNPDNLIGEQKDGLGIAANYAIGFAGIDFLASAGWYGSTLEANTGNNVFSNRRSWNIGAQIAYAGFTLGAGYMTDNSGIAKGLVFNPLPSRQHHWNVGLTYAWERWRIGVGYYTSAVEARDDTGARLGQDRYQGVSVGAGYRLGPGILVNGGIETGQWRSYSHAPADQNRGTAYLLGSILSF
ncbi:MAG: porin [Alphaproteobacteria bacterium]|jgi:predicted porin|nr:porin [Alphaproteobacteria bacterium]